MALKLVARNKADNKEETIDVTELVKRATEQSAEQTRNIMLNTETGDGKLSDVLKNIKNKGLSREEDLVDCPTCGRDHDGHKGHAHKLKNDKGILRCTGPECKQEYIIVPKEKAEWVCETCNQPHIKIDTRNKKIAKDDVCVGCGSDHFKPMEVIK